MRRNILKIPKKITNPMTIIAIFALISETSAAISLPFLDGEDRQTYLWFLISFPFYLLFLFFLTLNFNYRSLYSPSDFSDDKAFLKNLEKKDRDNKRNCAVQESLLRPVTGVSISVLFCEEASAPSKNSQRTDNTSDPPSNRNKLFVRHNIQLSGSTSNLDIIDARQMGTQTDFATVLEKIRQSNKQHSRLIVFLSNDVSDFLLKENILRNNKHSKKSANLTFCIIYNTSSQNVCVLESF